MTSNSFLIIMSMKAMNDTKIQMDVFYMIFLVMVAYSRTK